VSVEHDIDALEKAVADDPTFVQKRRRWDEAYTFELVTVHEAAEALSVAGVEGKHGRVELEFLATKAEADFAVGVVVVVD